MKVDLGEMRPDYSGEVIAQTSKPPKKQIKEFPTVYIKNPQDLGITVDMVGDKIHLEFDCRIKSVEIVKKASMSDDKNTPTKRDECCIELMQAYTEDDEEATENETGDDIQDGISKGIKDLSDNED